MKFNRKMRLSFMVKTWVSNKFVVPKVPIKGNSVCVWRYLVQFKSNLSFDSFLIVQEFFSHFYASSQAPKFGLFIGIRCLFFFHGVLINVMKWWPLEIQIFSVCQKGHRSLLAVTKESVFHQSQLKQFSTSC